MMFYHSFFFAVSKVRGGMRLEERAWEHRKTVAVIRVDVLRLSFTGYPVIFLFLGSDKSSA